jgi:serine/threonine protein kinase
MADLNTILTLTPKDEFGLTADAFRLPHNISRYLKPSAFMDDGLSRETTPFDAGNNEPAVNDLEYFHRIRLSFDQETRVKGRVTFGSDPNRCDVLLASRRGQHYTSGLHFYVTFDDQQRPVIKDVSTNGLRVSYDGQAKYERRDHFQWIIFPKFETITVVLRKQGLAFDIHLPKHYKTHPRKYKDNVKSFMTDAPQEHLVVFNNLALRSQDTSLAPSEILSPSKRPIYLEYTKLGHGAYGQVYKVVDASTGFEYAGKEFFSMKGWKEIEIMRRLRHVRHDLTYDPPTVKIANSLKEHIVEFVDFRMEPKPLLVMEYLPLGDLEAQHKDYGIAEADMMIIFDQCLRGLCYLHDHNIVHRDLKPANILVCSRSPPSIKLADFGLAQDNSDMKTFCGSPMYAAPEIFLGQHYTDAVDIWSLAVIVMEFVYGLPRYEGPGNANQKRELRSWGHAWCLHLIAKADDWDLDPLIGFLTEHMLKWEPQDRLSAAECVRTASTRGLFDGTISRTGNVTPRQPHGGADDINTEEASTIMGPLWRNVSMSLRNEGHMSRSQGPCCPLIPECGQGEPSHTRVEGSANHESTSLFPEQDNIKPAKRRRTTNDPDPRDLQHPPSGKQLSLPQIAFDRGRQAEPPKGKSAKFYLVNFRDNVVAMRKADFWVCATHITRAAGLSRKAVTTLLQLNQPAFEMVKGHHLHQGTYVDFDSGLRFCEQVQQSDLIAILRKARELLQKETEFSQLTFGEHQVAIDLTDFPEFWQLTFGEHRVTIDLTDFCVNMTDLFKVISGGKRDVQTFKDHNPAFSFRIRKGKYPGTYVSFECAYNLCDQHGHQGIRQVLEESLRDLKTRRHEREQATLSSSESLAAKATNPCVPRQLSKVLAYEESSSQQENSVRGIPDQDFIFPLDELRSEAVKSTPCQVQSMCEIPPLPHLSANSIDNLSAAENGDLSQRDQADPLLYTGSMSNRSYLSPMRPSSGLERLSSHYFQSLDED